MIPHYWLLRSFPSPSDISPGTSPVSELWSADRQPKQVINHLLITAVILKASNKLSRTRQHFKGISRENTHACMYFRNDGGATVQVLKPRQIQRRCTRLTPLLHITLMYLSFCLEFKLNVKMSIAHQQILFRRLKLVSAEFRSSHSTHETTISRLRCNNKVCWLQGTRLCLSYL